MRRLAHLAPFLMVVLTAGCERGGTYGTSSATSSWSGDRGTPGIDDGSITSLEVWNGPAEPVTFAVWSDLPAQTGRSSSGARGASVEWRQYAADGRNVEIRYEATGGKPGSVEIAGRRFDPANGPLFLVRTDREPYRVEQVEFDLGRLPLGNVSGDTGVERHNDRIAAIKDLARSEPRIGGFFGAGPTDGSDAAGAPTGSRVGRAGSIDGEAIERIEKRLDGGGANDSFPPSAEPPLETEAQPVERP